MKIKPDFLALILVNECLSGCSGLDMCNNQQEQSIQSPNGKMKVVVFTRDCGATTSYSKQVSILNAQEPLPSEGGNLFVAGNSKVWVRWINNQRLKVAYEKSVKPILQVQQFSGVDVVYQAR